MRRVIIISGLILLVPVVMAVHLNVFAQDDEESVDRDNSVWTDVIPEQETEEISAGQEAESSVTESEAEGQDGQGSFIPTEKINVDSAISFPVDI